MAREEGAAAATAVALEWTRAFRVVATKGAAPRLQLREGALSDPASLPGRGPAEERLALALAGVAAALPPGALRGAPAGGGADSRPARLG